MNKSELSKTHCDTLVMVCQLMHWNMACSVNVFRFNSSFSPTQMNFKKGVGGECRKLIQCAGFLKKWGFFVLFSGTVKK